MKGNIPFLLTLYRALLRHAAFWLVAIVTLKLISLLSLLASLLLPWQLLMMVDGRSVYAAAWLPSENTVALMGTGIVAAFVSHLLAEWGTGVAAQRGARRMLAIHQKTGLFANYPARARATFLQLALGLAALVMCLVVAVALCIVYPVLALGMLAYFLLWALAWPLLEAMAPAWWARMKEGQAFKLGWYAGFVFLLVWAVATYDRDTAPPLHWLFLCVLAARQVVLQVFQALAAWRRVLLNRAKVGLLFLSQAEHREPQRPRQAEFDQRLLQLTQSSPWINRLLQQAGLQGRQGEARALLAETGSIAYVSVPLSAVATDQSSAVPDACLIKVFNREKLAVGEHEQSLLSVAEPHWPAPRLLHAESSAELVSLVWAWNASAVWLGTTQRKAQAPDLRRRLLACDLPPELVQRYRRAHGDLASAWVQDLDWQRARALASHREALESLDRLARARGRIQESLASLPCQLVLPGLLSRRIALAGEGTIVLCNWTRWHWLSVGAGWPPETPRDELEEALAWAAAWRPELGKVNPDRIRLAAAIQALRQAAQSQDYIALERAVARVVALL